VIIFLASSFSIELTPFYLGIAAEQRDYEIKKFDENITIQSHNLHYITYTLDEGDEFEIIYTVLVKESLPIDIWLVNEDNYLLLMNDAQFLFFIDGTEQDVIYTKKIVSLKENGIYVLVMANYNNQSVEANVISELRTYIAETSEPSSWDLSYFFYPLLLAVIILTVLFIVFFFKARNYKKSLPKASLKAYSDNKSKKQKANKANTMVSDKKPPIITNVRKARKTKLKVTDEELLKKPETFEPEEAESEVSDNISTSFCGSCGKPVITAYCTNCGVKV
jgi:hypothetical protein